MFVNENFYFQILFYFLTNNSFKMIDKQLTLNSKIHLSHFCKSIAKFATKMLDHWKKATIQFEKQKFDNMTDFFFNIMYNSENDENT